MAYTNKFYIDGKEAREAYGASLLEGSYIELLCPAKLKKVESNDWAEYDGLEPDLSSPVLDSREVKLPVYVRGGESAANAFIKALSFDPRPGEVSTLTSAYHEFNVPDLGRTWKLRLKSVDVDEYWPGGNLSLSATLVDDFPLDGYDYLEPQSDLKTDESCAIGGRPFSDYGVKLTEGGIVVMGNEGRGVSERVARHIDHRLFIPPYPADRHGSESLNVAMATGIVCAEFRRRAARR